ncbi:MAG: ureidoglycolate hydrolase [bacterium ADurb.Bin429]|nr:MAG: ureidoglycolate hydrolase [bacterium ADurb.Bin429]
MRKVKQLTAESFKPFGTFGALTPPTDTPLVDAGVIKFWPDCGGVLSLGPFGNNEVAIGVCQVTWRNPQVDVTEFHSSTGEGNIPLDGDIYIHVAPPSPGDEPPLDAFEIFRVPQGTCVVLKPGVWHHAPFSTKPGAVVNTVILLPQRTYANDCEVAELDADEVVTFEA